jgi:hypothetical protein
VAFVAIFTAMTVGSDIALSGLVNVKLLDTFVFVSAYLFGFRVGAAVGLLSETIWSVYSPYGFAGAIAPFLLVGELVFALAGWTASKVWGPEIKLNSPYPLFVGGMLTVCAFVWDFETNAATALLGYSPNAFWVGVFGPQTLLFIIPHEISDFVFGTLLAPLFISIIPRTVGRKS